MEDERLPKGMKKLPEEYVDYTDDSITHEDIDYSKIIRESFRNLEKKGLVVDVKRFEMIEQEGGPSLVSIIAEVHKK